MRIKKRAILLSVVILCCFALAWSARRASAQGPEKEMTTQQALQAFAAIQPIDVHVHVFKTDPTFQSMLGRLHLKVMNILVMDDTLPYRRQLSAQVDVARELDRSGRGHIAWCTTFDPYKFGSPSFTADAIRQLDKNFAQGAIAVKIWKNIGMELKHNGKFVFADDPQFETIYKDIARHGKTLMSHQAEPDVAWGPPDPSDPSWSYYQENPQWFLYNKPGFPSKQEILRARDHVLEMNPHLRMVGVHLGSMEKDLDNIARHFDQYPNFAIDMAARMEYLMLTPRDKVRAFLIKYQDRVLYGTDLDLLPDANVANDLKDWESTYARDWKFLATDQTLDYNGKKIHGLSLPEPVLRKIFRTNAQHWIPGL
jgi:predicted TIM-barrel fold metal-dependent hydrolase